jgi:hypothetical protein
MKLILLKLRNFFGLYKIQQWPLDFQIMADKNGRAFGDADGTAKDVDKYYESVALMQRAMRLIHLLKIGNLFILTVWVAAILNIAYGGHHYLPIFISFLTVCVSWPLIMVYENFIFRKSLRLFNEFWSANHDGLVIIDDADMHNFKCP